MEQDAQLTLVLESITEIMARLKLLDETQAHLEAAVERQLELQEVLLTRQAQMLALMQAQVECTSNESSMSQTQPRQQHPAQSRSEANREDRLMGVRVNRLTDHDNEYSRETHPALFKVIDLLERDGQACQSSVRKLAQETGVSKSWCAIARSYVLRKKTVH